MGASFEKGGQNYKTENLIIFLVLWGFTLFASISLTLCIIESSPKPPVIQVDSVNTTTPFTINNPTNTVSGSLNITFWVEAPYKGDIYHKATVQVYYRSLLLSSSTAFDSLCPGKPSCDNATPQSWLPVTVVVSSVPVSDPVTTFAIMSDLRREELSLNVKIVADFRRNPECPGELRVTCDDVKIGVPSGVMIVGPKNCKVYWSLNLDTPSNWKMGVGCCVLGSLVFSCLVFMFMFIKSWVLGH